MSLNPSVTFIKFLPFQNVRTKTSPSFQFLFHYSFLSITSCFFIILSCWSLPVSSSFFFPFWLFNSVVRNCRRFHLSWESPLFIWFQVSWELSMLTEPMIICIILSFETIIICNWHYWLFHNNSLQLSIYHQQHQNFRNCNLTHQSPSSFHSWMFNSFSSSTRIPPPAKI